MDTTKPVKKLTRKIIAMDADASGCYLTSHHYCDKLLVASSTMWENQALIIISQPTGSKVVHMDKPSLSKIERSIVLRLP